MQDIVLDVNEDTVNKLHPELLTTLLLDRTTRKNILWGTDDYKELALNVIENAEAACCQKLSLTVLLCLLRDTAELSYWIALSEMKKPESSIIVKESLAIMMTLTMWRN